MKIKLITVLLAFLLLTGALLYMQNLTPQPMAQAPTAKEKVSGPLAPFPDVVFHAADGKDFGVGDLSEKIVLVHFWAAWCAVCYTEFPDLLKYVAQGKGKIALVSVSLDDDYAESRKALDKIAAKSRLSTQAPHLYWAWDKDKSLSLKIFNTVKLPETIVVDENRRMADKIVGLGPWNEALTPQ